jgi:hypothetical protein
VFTQAFVQIEMQIQLIIQFIVSLTYLSLACFMRSFAMEYLPEGTMSDSIICRLRALCFILFLGTATRSGIIQLQLINVFQYMREMTDTSLTKYIVVMATTGFMSLSEIIIFFSQLLLLVEMKTPVAETLEFDEPERESRLDQQLIQNERGSSSLSAFLAK